MRILIASDTYYPHVNGASYSTQRLAHALAARGHEVAVIAPSQTTSNTDEKADGVRVHGVRSFPIFFLLTNFRFTLGPIATLQARKIIWEYRPDIVHIQMPFAISSATLRYARKLNLPIVATNHFMPENLVHYLPLPSVIINKIVAILWKYAARVYNKTAIVTSPTVTAQRVLERWYKGPNVVISNGVSLEGFHQRHDTTEVKKIYGLPEKPMLLFVGRLDKEKNVDVALRAVREALKKTDFHFVIAGIGAEAKNLEKLAEDLKIDKNVTFAGFVPDELLPSLYAAVDCFINPGIAELQGMSVMEAMASSLPILAAKAVALPELVRDGENGFLFEPGDVKTLTEKLIAIFSNRDLRQKMGAKSNEIIQAHDLDQSIVEFESLYEQVIKNHRTDKS